MDDRIGKLDFVIEPSRCDFNGNAPVTYICDKALQAATIHADRREFGFDVMESLQKAWVISRMGFYFTRMPSHNENVSILTWVNSVEKYFTRRNFEMIDENGFSIMQAQSMWAAIDFNTRRPTDRNTMNDSKLMKYLMQDPEGYAVPRLKKIPAVECDPAFTHKAVYSDIDLNRHFNSVKYIEHALNLFDEELFSGHEVKSLEVVYLNETLAGTEMLFCRDGGTVDIKRDYDLSSLCRLSFSFD